MPDLSCAHSCRPLLPPLSALTAHAPPRHAVGADECARGGWSSAARPSRPRARVWNFRRIGLPHRRLRSLHVRAAGFRVRESTTPHAGAVPHEPRVEHSVRGGRVPRDRHPRPFRAGRLAPRCPRRVGWRTERPEAREGREVEVALSTRCCTDAVVGGQKAAGSREPAGRSAHASWLHATHHVLRAVPDRERAGAAALPAREG